jgi:hypothetical protein
LTRIVRFAQKTAMIHLPKRTILAVLALLLLHAATASAQISLVTTRAGLAGTDFIDWGTLGPDGTTVSNPFTILSNGGVSVNVSKPFGQFLRGDEGISFTGNFNPGEQLLFTGYSSNGSGPITLNFGTFTTAFGVNIQANIVGDFVARLEFFDASNALLGTITENGASTTAGNGSAIFIGGKSGGSSTNFSSVRISTEQAGSPPSEFHINQADFSLAAVPDSGGTLLLLCGGLASVSLTRKVIAKPWPRGTRATQRARAAA